MRRETTARWVAWGALVAVVVIVALMLFGGGSGYVVNAQFTNAGQLVNGDLVTVAGHTVGSVGKISLSKNGLAVVQLDISDSHLDPLSSDTTATIGQLSLTGVANRFVSLSPGAGGEAIRSGGTLPVTRTTGIVELDAVLDAFTPQVRTSLQQLLHTGAYFISRPTGHDLGQLATSLDPAFSQLALLGGQIVSDQYSLKRLISSAASVTGGLAAHDAQLSGAITNTAQVLEEIAAERGALTDSLRRAPAVLAQADTVFQNVDTTLAALDPTARALAPVAPRLGTLLRDVVPFTTDLQPTVAGIRRLLPQAGTALSAFPAAGKAGGTALGSLTSALTSITPILSGLRPYVPDLVTGFFNGVGGSTGAIYDANGHMIHLRAVLSGSQATLSGLLAPLGITLGSTTGSGGQFFHPPNTCPGGGGFASADGSAPWTAPDSDASVGTLCTVGQDQQ